MGSDTWKETKWQEHKDVIFWGKPAQKSLACSVQESSKFGEYFFLEYFLHINLENIIVKAMDNH